MTRQQYKYLLSIFPSLAAACCLVSCDSGRTLPVAPPVVPGTASLVYYTSSVDGTSQPYGLYVPANCDPETARPVVFYGHGYGGSATASFSTFQKDFADARGWLLVNLHGRKILFYDGPAEIEIDDVLAHIERTYAVDRGMLFFEGLSMGATGAFRLGARRPGFWAGVAGCDGWTDFREWHRHWYAPAAPDDWEVHPSRFHLLEAASPLFYAENFSRTPLYLVVDSGDTTVLPENGVKLHNRLLGFGVAHQYEYLSGGHCAGYDKTKIYNFFAGLPRVSYEHAEVKTRRLWHARDTWLGIRRFERWGRWASASGDLIPQPGPPFSPFPLEVSCAVENVSRLGIYLKSIGIAEAASFGLYVNGVFGGIFTVGSDATLPDALVELAWQDGVLQSITPLPPDEPYPPSGALAKRPEQEGPVCQALCRNVMAVYGTIHPDPLVNQANQDEANLFKSIWMNDMAGNLVVKADTAVTAQDIATRNLILFGTEESNLVIYNMYHDASRAFTPPVSVREDEIYVGDEGFTGPQYGVFFCYPNPLAPDRMVVVSHRAIKNWFFGFEALPWFYPDYVVFDTTLPLRNCVNGYEYPADAFVLAGYFDANWGLSPWYDVSIATDSLTYAYGSDTKAIVTATVTEGGAGTPVTGLVSSAFSAAIDGLGVPVSNWVETGGGDYEFEISLSNVPVNAYYISVQVEADDRYGEAWARIVVQ
jgi:predicted esterase